MEILQSSYAPGGGGVTLNISCYVDLDQAPSVYPPEKNIRMSTRHTPNIIES